MPKESDFKLVETPVLTPNVDEMIVHALYISVDPYMRGRMSDAKSYAAPVEIGGVMVGGVVGEVIESNNARFWRRRHRAGRIRLAGIYAQQRQGSAQDRSVDCTHLDRAGRVGHAGADGLLRTARHRPAQARRDRRRLRRGRSGRLDRRPDRQDQGLPRHRHRRQRRQGALRRATTWASTAR